MSSRPISQRTCSGCRAELAAGSASCPACGKLDMARLRADAVRAFLPAAAKIGPSTVALVEAIMKAKPHPEQGFRSCLGILSLEKSYGSGRVEAACRRGNDIGATSYGSIKSILQHGLDKAFAREPAPDAPPIRHGNIRGSGYFH